MKSENIMNIVTAMQIASAVVNVAATKKQNVKLLSIGLGLYFGSAVVSIIGSYKAMKEF